MGSLRHCSLYKFFIGIVCCHFCFTIVEAQTTGKKALLIGIGNYPPAGGWANLSSANDVKLIKTTLVNLGFDEKNMLTLADEQATRSNILKALQQDLPKIVSKGDFLVVHFSGHGQQCADKNGDELDGLDECIVPYDSPKKFEAGVNEGQFLIRDEELGAAFVKIRKILGPTGQLFFTEDACHSGTGTRGNVVARGTTSVMASPEFEAEHKKMLLKENNSLSDEAATDPKTLAPLVAFFGSAQNQLNYEMKTAGGESYGSLSFAVAKCLSNAKEQISFRNLFDQVRTEMSTIAKLQQPQSDGVLDMLLGDGKILAQTEYYLAGKVINNKQFTINGGELQGIYEGSEIGLFPADTRDFSDATPTARGTVKQAKASSSTILLDSACAEAIITKSWVYILQKSLGKNNVKVGTLGLSEENDRLIRDVIFKKSFVQEDQNTPDISIQQIQLSDTRTALVLRTSNGYALDSIAFANATLSAQMVEKLSFGIKTYLRGAIFRTMDFSSEDISVKFEIIPIESNVGVTDLDSLKPLLADADGNKKLPLKSKFKFLITNNGVRPAYFTIIDIEPSNKMVVVIPYGNKTLEEFKILPDQKKLIDRLIDVLPPEGVELLRLFASNEPIDLNTPLNTRGNKPSNPVERIYKNVMNDDFFQSNNKRGVEKVATDIHTYSESFIIAK